VLSKGSDRIVSGHEKMTITKNFADNPQKFLQKAICNEVRNVSYVTICRVMFLVILPEKAACRQACICTVTVQACRHATYTAIAVP